MDITIRGIKRYVETRIAEIKEQLRNDSLEDGHAEHLIGEEVALDALRQKFFPESKKKSTRKKAHKLYYVSCGGSFEIIRAHNQRQARVGAGYSPHSNLFVRIARNDEVLLYQAQREITTAPDYY